MARKSYWIDEENQLLNIEYVEDQWNKIDFDNASSIDLGPEARTILLQIFPPFIEDMKYLDILINYPKIHKLDNKQKSMEVVKLLYSILPEQWGVSASYDEHSDSKVKTIEFCSFNKLQVVNRFDFDSFLEQIARGFQKEELQQWTQEYLEIDIRGSDKQITKQVLSYVHKSRALNNINTLENKKIRRKSLRVDQELEVNNEPKAKAYSYQPMQKDFKVLQLYFEGVHSVEKISEIVGYSSGTAVSNRIKPILNFLLAHKENFESERTKIQDQMRKALYDSEIADEIYFDYTKAKEKKE
jgi:hypothetical protein